MNLSEKLRSFIGSKDSVKKGSFNCKPNKFLEKDRQLLKVLDADIVSTPLGEHVIIEKLFDSNFIHGDIALDSVFGISKKAFGLIGKDRAFESFNIQDTIFIDTETTGLSGGTGTYAFLIGVGFFTEQNFKIVQFLMRDFDEEASLLYNLKDILRKFNCIISFNGKTFDLPLLYTRFLMNNIKRLKNDFLHLDLLFSARRVYKGRLQCLSLSSLEENIIGIKRYKDIPGSEIPSIYFKYLQDREPALLKPIVYHNQVDILSLVTLLSILADGIENPFYSKNIKDEDYYCLARIYEDMGYINKSIECYKKAMVSYGTRERACTKLSLLYKRLGNWKEAEKLWLLMVKSNINKIFSLIELAKYYEHRVKNYQKAETATLMAIETSYKRARLLGRFPQDGLEDLEKRLHRVRNKMKKASL